MSLANIPGESDSRSQGTRRKAATPGLEEEPVGAEAEAAASAETENARLAWEPRLS